MERLPEIRSPSRADVERIGAIIAANNMFEPELLDEMMAAYFDGDDQQLWFVIGNPVRAVAYAVPEQLTNGTWNQLMIAVDPAEHGEGLGKTLMRNLETVVGSRGGRLIVVDTSSTSAFEGTRAFYRAIGYTEDARIRDFWDDGDDKIIFRRAIER